MSNRDETPGETVAAFQKNSFYLSLLNTCEIVEAFIKKQCNFKHLIIFVPLEVSLGSMQCMQEQKLIKMRTLLANVGQTNWTFD